MNIKNLNRNFVTICSSAILTFGVWSFANMYKQHKESEQIIAACFANFEQLEQVTITKEPFAVAVCEQS